MSVSLSLMLASQVIALGLAAAAAGPKAEKPRPEVGRVAKAYKGPEGLTLVVLRIGPEKDGTFLIKYDGIDHAWAGKIFKARRVNAGTGHDLVITWDKGDYHTVVEREAWGGKRMQVYLPDRRDGEDVGYDEKLSKDVVPEHLLTEYLEQKP
jgi:hypothetical protein